ncbi:hypothetical protein G7Z17_g684 [Cylindrodendrum hubeiense]|uniref:Protein kinase domain-containing protein n=1 Tax=Cylindrodendrum hubeiense TaxID=595255 RepID=A0A9P5HP77_9HYPO|nr:hypothetical protein G7Z17_g684 [Cylindrodendrum hubeiense]
MATATSLEDHGFIEVHDGGNEHICRRLWSTRPVSAHGPCTVPRTKVAAAIRSALKDARVDADNRSKFVPVDSLGKIITESNILQLLRELKSCDDLSGRDMEQLAAKICRVPDAAPRCSYRKVVATLIKIEREEDIPNIVQEGFRDNCLPLVCASRTYDLRHRATRELSRTMQKWPAKTRLKFWKATDKYNAPVFMRPKTRGIYHYILYQQMILPFEEKLATEDDGGDFEDADPDDQVDGDEGGFSKVDPTLTDIQIPTNDHKFAIKSLNTKHKKDFEDEVEVLLRFTHREEHQLVKLLATYELRKGKDVSYHLIFPWADWSVRTLWRELKPVDQKDPSRLQWIAGESVAIGNSLAFIHDEYAAGLSPEKRERWGRHGDIKAGNFLVYKDPSRPTGSGLIFMADFGLSRFHRQQSRSMVNPRAASPSYRPPEFDLVGGTLSRKSDIWSLGAFFLEFLTWYLKGHEAVETTFPEFRATEDHQRINSDIFFQIEERAGSQKASVKPEVTKWITFLHCHQYASHYVHDLLDLIETKMLVVNKNSRITATDLKKELQSMYRRLSASNPAENQDRHCATHSEAVLPLSPELVEALSQLGRILVGFAQHMFRRRAGARDGGQTAPRGPSICSRAKNFSEDEASPLSYVPFSRSTFKDILRKFRIHRTIARTVSREPAYFSSTTIDEPDHLAPSIVLTCRTSSAWSDDVAMALTHSPQTSTTFAIIFGCNEMQRRQIEGRVRAVTPMALAHPGLLPGILAELERKRLTELVEYTLDRFTLRAGGTSTGASEHVDTLHMSEQQMGEYLELCYESQNLAKEFKAVKRQLSKMTQFCDDISFPGLCPRITHDEMITTETIQEGLANIGTKIKKRTIEIMDEYDNKIDECGMVMDNTSITMQTAIFSMGIFDWSPGAGTVVSKYIWIFVVLSVGLTVVTVLAWYLATRDKKKKNVGAIEELGMRPSETF